jgi:hypothetical protein
VRFRAPLHLAILESTSLTVCAALGIVLIKEDGSVKIRLFSDWNCTEIPQLHQLTFLTQPLLEAQWVIN